MKIISLVLAVIFSTLVEAQTNPRDFLTPEFRDLETTLVYKDSQGNLKTEQYFSKLGRLKRGINAFTLTSVNNELPSSIPTVGLAAEHWWLSFEMLMIAQRDYAACVGAVNEHHRRLKVCLIDDPSCSPLASTVFVIRDYWVPFNIVFDMGVPTKDTYIAHFEAGMLSVNQAIYHTSLCTGYLNYLRTIP